MASFYQSLVIKTRKQTLSEIKELINANRTTNPEEDEWGKYSLSIFSEVCITKYKLSFLEPYQNGYGLIDVYEEESDTEDEIMNLQEIEGYDFFQIDVVSADEDLEREMMQGDTEIKNLDLLFLTKMDGGLYQLVLEMDWRGGYCAGDGGYVESELEIYLIGYYCDLKFNQLNEKIEWKI